MLPLHSGKVAITSGTAQGGSRREACGEVSHGVSFTSPITAICELGWHGQLQSFSHVP